MNSREIRRRRRAATDRGATAVEYALMLALIAGVIFTAVLAFGPVVADLYASATEGW